MSILNYKGKCPICGTDVNFLTMSTIKYHNEHLCMGCVKKITNNGGILQFRNFDNKDIGYLRELATSEQANNNAPKGTKKSRKKFIIGLIAVIIIISIMGNAFSDEEPNAQTGQEISQSETTPSDNNSPTTDNTKNDPLTETIGQLKNLGFTVDEATNIYNLFVKVGINQISEVQTGAGTGIDNLQSFVAIANNDKNLKFYFTVENREMYYIGFRDATLYDNTKGGVLKNIGDVPTK